MVIAGFTTGSLLAVCIRSPWVDDRHFILFYLTMWSYLILSVYFIVAAVVSCYCYIVKRKVKIPSAFHMKQKVGDSTGAANGGFREDPDDPLPETSVVSSDSAEIIVDKDSKDLPWYIRVQWILGNMAVPISFIITIMYFGVLFPSDILVQNREEQGIVTISIGDLSTHGLNSVCAFLDISISASPWRLFHFIYPTLYSIVYVLFSVVYWALDPQNNIIYPVILDWNEPMIPLIVVAPLGLVGIPVMMFFIWLVHKFKVYLSGKCRKEKVPTPIEYSRYINSAQGRMRVAAITLPPNYNY
ncbi:protein rolling stone-like isoform X2 [Lineus longissimus]